MSLKQFTKELNGSRVEGELVRTIAYSLIPSFLCIAAFYYLTKATPQLFQKYGFFLFFAAISYSLITPTIRQVRAYKQFPCMSGMMIGMTIGMISGFIGGFYVGATNGMFIGSLFGIVIGITFGVWLGSSCGVMGSMEGVMAGFMGGLMGAMTAVMMLNDGLRLATALVFAVTSVILAGLNYLIYTETKEAEREVREGYILTSIISFIVFLVTIFLMLFGPRSILFS